MAHIALLQDACRPQQRLNPDEAVFQRLDILAITVIELVMTDEHEIGNGNGYHIAVPLVMIPLFMLDRKDTTRITAHALYTY